MSKIYYTVAVEIQIQIDRPASHVRQVCSHVNILPSSSIPNSSSVAQEQKHLTERVTPQIHDIPAD